MMSGEQRRTPWIEFCALLTFAQVLIAGYRYGVANQSIQTTILKHLIDPGLFVNDPLIATMQHYPSMFFQWLAAILPSTAAIQPACFFLHILTIFGLFCGICLLARGLTGKWTAGMLALVIIIAGHWSGVAESNLYTTEFTHTRAAFCLAALAMGLCACCAPHLARRRMVPGLSAFILLGLMFYVHPLMACYVSAMMGTWLLADLSRHNWKRLLLCALPAAILAAPVMMLILSDTQEFGQDWIRLVRIRSPHHVFPSTWWAPGNYEIPQFMLLTGFAVLSLSAARPRKEHLLKLELTGLVVLAMFLCGYVFTELLPVPAVMRAQLFRSSQFIALLAAITVAGWAVEDVRETFAIKRHMFRIILPVLVVICLAVPALSVLLPVLLLAAAIALLARARLTWWAALWTGLVLLCCAAAWRQIGFPLIALPQLPSTQDDQILGLVLIAVGVMLAVICNIPKYRKTGPLLSAACIVLCAAMLCRLYPASQIMEETGWDRIQRLTRSLTPTNAVILVPPIPGGFRVYSDRAVVGEWRDGTQQFFDANYNELWWERMGSLRSGMLYDASGARLLSRGREFHSLPETSIESILHEYCASYFVSKAQSLDFVPLAKSDPWTLYSAERIVHPPPSPPKGTSDAEIWAQQEAFMQTVVYPNIEKYRKSDVELVVTDSKGRLLKGAAFALEQTSSTFLFGSALPNFIQPKPPLVAGNREKLDEKQLARFKELFNFTIIGYAGKWNAIEAQKDEPWFDNLDKYVQWCTDNRITIEYHFVSGYPPSWLQPLTPPERQQAFLTHAGRLIERYGDKIKYWQVVNERHNLNESPDVFALFRKKLPGSRLGISNCARFYSTEVDEARRKSDMLHGCSEMEWLAKQKVALDFFGYHGHRPFGLWADVREIYEGLDYCRKYGVRVHISEFGMHLPHEMTGPVRTGQWTEQLQAEYYRRYYTVCFSHPLVDAINMWGIGPGAWISGGGLLDRDNEPKMAFQELKKLIREEWRTRKEGDIALDGHIQFRGFHGNYEIRITDKSSGAAYTSRFSVAPGSNNTYRILIDEKTSSADIAPLP